MQNTETSFQPKTGATTNGNTGPSTGLMDATRAGQLWSTLVNICPPGQYIQKQKQKQHQHHLKTRSEEHTSELQSRQYLVCRLLLENKSTERSTATRDLDIARKRARRRFDSAS